MKSKAARVTLTVLFLAVLFVPGIVWLIAGDKLATPNRENRELAQWPEFRWADIEKLPGKLENYYRDHLPFRNQVISAYAQGLRTVFDDSVVTTVLFGKNDWFFYKNVNDGDPIGSYRGEDLFTPQELRQIVLNLRHTRDNLAKQGIEFVLFIAPNKERVYSEFLPDRYGAPAQDYAAKQLVDFLRTHSDIRVVYANDEIMQAKAEFPDLPLYFSSDTHWNGLGAYIGARALMRELGIDLPAMTRESILQSGAARTGDLSILAHLDTVIDGDRNYTVEGERPSYTSNADKSNMEYHCTGDPAGKKLYIKSDSFASPMFPYILPWFSETQLYFNERYQQTQVDDFQPDIFVQVCVERYVRKWLERGELYTLPQNRQ